MHSSSKLGLITHGWILAMFSSVAERVSSATVPPQSLMNMQISQKMSSVTPSGIAPATTTSVAGRISSDSAVSSSSIVRWRILGLLRISRVKVPSGVTMLMFSRIRRARG